MTPKERAILEKFIKNRESEGKLTERTKAKIRHFTYTIIAALHEIGKHLDTATGEDFKNVAAILSERGTQNTRQSLIAQLKSMVRFLMEDEGYQIAGASKILKVKSGSASKRVKDILSREEWEQVLNAQMSNRERAFLAMTFDGCHRPGEPYQLKWSDLKINGAGLIEYTITFKTGKPRIIVQQPGTTALLELYRMETRAEYGKTDAYIFPTLDKQTKYTTLTQARKLIERIRIETGIKKLTPGSLRNTAITFDVEDGKPLGYICLRAWGEAYNPMINVYCNADSSRMQINEQAKNGNAATPILKPKPREIRKSIKKCPACKEDNSIDTIFCQHCGTRMDGKKGESVTELKAEIDDLKNLVHQMISKDGGKAHGAVVSEDLLKAFDEKKQ